MTQATQLIWDRTPLDFAGLATAVLNLPASHWAELGAHFIAGGEGEPTALATGSVDTALGQKQPFAVLDEGDVTTLLVPGSKAPHEVVGAAVLLALAGAGCLDPASDVLQMNVGAGREGTEQPVATLAVPMIDELQTRPQDASRASAELFERLPVSSGPRRPTMIGLLAGLGGADDVEVLAQLPSERLPFAARGATIVAASLLSAATIGWALHTFLATPQGWAIFAAVFWVAATISLERATLPIRRPSPVATLAAAIPRLLIAIVFAVLIGELVVVRVFAGDIALHTGDASPGLLEAVTTLQKLTADEPALLVARVLIELFVVLLLMLPSLTTLLASFGSPSVYEQVASSRAMHAAERVEYAEQLRDAASRAASRKMEAVLRSPSSTDGED